MNLILGEIGRYWRVLTDVSQGTHDKSEKGQTSQRLTAVYLRHRGQC